MVHPGNGGDKDTPNKIEALGDYDGLPVRHMVLMTMMMMMFTMIMMILWT